MCSTSKGTSLVRFQFIGFPSEWGEHVWLPFLFLLRRFQFIGFPSEWGGFSTF